MGGRRTASTSADCHAYSDSFFDVPLLRRGRATPTRSTPTPAWRPWPLARRWPLEHWDRPPGVPSVVGLEPYHLLRPFVRPESFPYARFTVNGIEHIPARGRCCSSPTTAATSTSPPWPWWPPASAGRSASWANRSSSTPRWSASWPGPWAASRSTGAAGSGEPMRRATAALRAGEAVIVLPQGTIPRGEAFFDPVLQGKTGAARLAAATGAPVVPIGLWGTEKVWPRSSKVPNVTTLHHPPRVTRHRRARPVRLGLDRRGGRHGDHHGRRGRPAARRGRAGRHEPTDEELAATRPSA